MGLGTGATHDNGAHGLHARSNPALYRAPLVARCHTVTVLGSIEGGGTRSRLTRCLVRAIRISGIFLERKIARDFEINTIV